MYSLILLTILLSIAYSTTQEHSGHHECNRYFNKSLQLHYDLSHWSLGRFDDLKYHTDFDSADHLYMWNVCGKPADSPRQACADIDNGNIAGAYRFTPGRAFNSAGKCYRLSDTEGKENWSYNPEDGTSGITVSWTGGDKGCANDEERSFKINFRCHGQHYGWTDVTENNCKYEMDNWDTYNCPLGCSIDFHDNLCGSRGVCGYDYSDEKARCFCYAGFKGPGCNVEIGFNNSQITPESSDNFDPSDEFSKRFTVNMDIARSEFGWYSKQFLNPTLDFDINGFVDKENPTPIHSDDLEYGIWIGLLQKVSAQNLPDECKNIDNNNIETTTIAPIGSTTTNNEIVGSTTTTNNQNVGTTTTSNNANIGSTTTNNPNVGSTTTTSNQNVGSTTTTNNQNVGSTTTANNQIVGSTTTINNENIGSTTTTNNANIGSTTTTENIDPVIAAILSKLDAVKEEISEENDDAAGISEQSPKLLDGFAYHYDKNTKKCNSLGSKISNWAVLDNIEDYAHGFKISYTEGSICETANGTTTHYSMEIDFVCPKSNLAESWDKNNHVIKSDASKFVTKCHFKTTIENPLACPHQCRTNLDDNKVSVCSGKGLCVLDPFYSHARCVCDHGYKGNHCEIQDTTTIFKPQSIEPQLALRSRNKISRKISRLQKIEKMLKNLQNKF